MTANETESSSYMSAQVSNVISWINSHVTTFRSCKIQNPQIFRPKAALFCAHWEIQNLVFMFFSQLFPGFAPATCFSTSKELLALTMFKIQPYWANVLICICIITKGFWYTMLWHDFIVGEHSTVKIHWIFMTFFWLYWPWYETQNET